MPHTNKKTNRELLKEALSEEDFKKAIKNCKDDYEGVCVHFLDRHNDIASYSLIGAFDWFESEQGFDYWNKIYIELKFKERQNG